MCVLSRFSYSWLSVTLWTVACQAPLSIGFSWQEYCSGLPCSPPEDLPDPGMEPTSLCLLHWLAGSLPLAPPGKPVPPYITSLTGHVPLYRNVKLLHYRKKEYIFITVISKAKEDFLFYSDSLLPFFSERLIVLVTRKACSKKTHGQSPKFAPLLSPDLNSIHCQFSSPVSIPWFSAGCQYILHAWSLEKVTTFLDIWQSTKGLKEAIMCTSVIRSNFLCSF